MKTIRVLAMAVATLLLSSVAVPAQQPGKTRPNPAKATPNIPSVDQIISKYVQALGGEDAYRKLTSRVIKGTATLSVMPNKIGTIEAFEKAPNKSLVIVSFPGVGVTREGYNGVIGWSHDEQEGVRLIEGAELASSKVDSYFYKDIQLKEVFSTLTFKGAQKVGTFNTYKLVGVSAEGHTETMYFDSASGLLVKSESVEVSPEGKMSIAIHYEDYRVVDGIKLPFVARHKSPELTMVLKITEVRHNVMIEDEKFEKPAAK